MFAWGVSEELVEPHTHAALAVVECVPRGSHGVVEHPPVEPVSDEIVALTLPLLPAVVADMVRIQLLTGSRPGEICMMRPCDIDRSEDIWVYRPQHHKTEHHNKERTILIGPRAQAILGSYLTRERERYCFEPRQAEENRNARKRAERASPMTPSQAARKPKVRRKRSPGNYYTNDSYRRAIVRACRRAFPAPADLSPSEQKHWAADHAWSPNQLRHAAATKICNRFESLLAAKETLGHSTIRVTEIYAKPSLELAKRAMREMG
jgi:integrase